jgi:hypothetical protein
VARPELGTKHTCPECEVKFYDLNKTGAACPACGHVIVKELDAAGDKEIPVANPSSNGLKPPETGDDFNDDEAGVIDDDKDSADLSDDDTVGVAEDEDVAEVSDVVEIVVDDDVV